MKKIYAYLLCKKATTAIEYVLIASGIALGLLGVLIVFGNDMINLYDLLPDLFG